MAELLPWLFVFGAVFGILGGLVSLWMSLSLALSGQSFSGDRTRLTSEVRLSLLTEKEALLQEIRDVTFEHDAGKLSDEDYEELNAKLRAQARSVLHELDESAVEYRDKAEALIAKRLGAAK
jgi:hypothetical protein